MCVRGIVHLCDMTHSDVWHDMFTCLIRRGDMIDSYECQATHMNESCYSHELVMFHIWIENVTYRSYIWTNHVLNHSDVKLDKFVRVTWLIHMCHIWVGWDTIHPYVLHDSVIQRSHVTQMSEPPHTHQIFKWFVNGTWFIHMYDMIHLYVTELTNHSDVKQDFFVRVKWLICIMNTSRFISKWATWFIHM